MQHILNKRFGTLGLMVLAAGLSRLLPHPSNFTPVEAMALFGAAYFTNRWLALALPLVSLWISDLVLNNVVYAQYNDHFVWLYGGFYWVYGAFILNAVLGMFLLKKVSPLRVLFTCLLSGGLFFIITNFGVWLGSSMYPQTWSGLLMCYTVALPYLTNTLAGNVVYAAVMFGAFELAQQRLSVLKIKA